MSRLKALLVSAMIMTGMPLIQAAYDTAGFIVNHPGPDVQVLPFTRDIPQGKSVELLGIAKAGRRVKQILSTKLLADPGGLIRSSNPGITAVKMVTNSSAPARHYVLTFGGRYEPAGAGGSGGPTTYTWSATTGVSVKQRAVEIDWANPKHQGKHVVLNNGALTDYLHVNKWGGPWNDYDKDTSEWLQGPHNQKRAKVAKIGDDYDPKLEKAGKDLVTVQYNFPDGTYAFDRFDLVIKKQIQDITLKSGPEYGGVPGTKVVVNGIALQVHPDEEEEIDHVEVTYRYQFRWSTSGSTYKEITNQQLKKTKENVYIGAVAGIIKVVTLNVGAEWDHTLSEQLETIFEESFSWNLEGSTELSNTVGKI